MSLRPRLVRQLLRRGQGLEKIFREVRIQQALLDELRELLPASLVPHCLAAHIDRQNLVLHTDSPAWATRLRFLSPQLLGQLRGRHPGLASIRVRLQPQQVTQPASAPRPPRHSVRAGELIRSGAAAISDTQLRDALERLGASVSKRRDEH